MAEETPENVLNFLKSNDALIKNLCKPYTRFILQLLTAIFPAMGILMYFLKVNTFSIVDLIVPIVFLALAISVLLFCFIWGYGKSHYLFYGIISVSFSCYIIYMIARAALYPANALYSLIGIAYWLLNSVLIIVGILSNIKRNLYTDGTKHLIRLFDSKYKYGFYIVGTRYTVIVTALNVITCILLLLSRYVFFAEFFNSLNDDKVILSFMILVFMFISCFCNFGWKLIIKQFYISKYKITPDDLLEEQEQIAEL